MDSISVGGSNPQARSLARKLGLQRRLQRQRQLRPVCHAIPSLFHPRHASLHVFACTLRAAPEGSAG